MNVWILSCGESISNCAITTDEAERAAALMGWETTIYDTKFDPSRMAAGMNQAIAAGADGVFTYAMDCPLMQQPLALAREAGVEVVGSEALDCDEPGFSSLLQYSEGDTPTFFSAVGRAQAIAVLAHVGTKANVLIPYQIDSLIERPVVEGFTSTIEEFCPDCKTKTIEWTFADAGSRLQQMVQQALVQDPSINAVEFGYTGILDLGPLAAMRAAGRLDDLYLAFGDPQPAVVSKLANGEYEGAGIGYSLVWEADAAMDNLNRVFHGEGPSNSGIGIQIYNSEHNIEDGEWVPPLDFTAAYNELFSQGASE
jgi:ribose transport system substrate-binding protein